MRDFCSVLSIFVICNVVMIKCLKSVNLVMNIVLHLFQNVFLSYFPDESSINFHGWSKKLSNRWQSRRLRRRHSHIWSINVRSLVNDDQECEEEATTHPPHIHSEVWFCQWMEAVWHTRIRKVKKRRPDILLPPRLAMATWQREPRLLCVKDWFPKCTSIQGMIMG